MYRIIETAPNKFSIQQRRRFRWSAIMVEYGTEDAGNTSPVEFDTVLDAENYITSLRVAVLNAQLYKQMMKRYPLVVKYF